MSTEISRRRFTNSRSPGIWNVRTLLGRIADSVAESEKYHLKLVFSDGSTHHTTRLGDADVTIMFRNRAAEWRMAFGGVFEFIESYFDGNVDIIGEQGLRRLVNLGYRKPFGALSTR